MKKSIKIFLCLMLATAIYWNLSALRERDKLPTKDSFLENFQVLQENLPSKDDTKAYIRENFPSLYNLSESVSAYVENFENLLYEE